MSPGDPHLFWSAAEDGVVRQYDTRINHQKSYTSPNALIHLTGSSKGGAGRTEIKGLDICQANPHMLALACGDPYVRLYDRRRLSPTGVSGAVKATPLMQLTPPHLPVGESTGGGGAVGEGCARVCRGRRSAQQGYADPGQGYPERGEEGAWRMYVHGEHGVSQSAAEDDDHICPCCLVAFWELPVEGFCWLAGCQAY